MLEQSQLIEMMRRMLAIRAFDTRAERLVDRGEIVGSIHTSIGQEAVCVGGCMAVREDDYMTGHHRSHGHPIGKGADLKKLMAELYGKTTGVCHGLGGSMHLADFTVGSLGEAAIVASSLPIAVGAGLASKLAGEDKVCLAFFGDGASNAGVFHESLNMASIWDLPVVFLCENNQYAVSTRHDTVCSVERIADRAPAYSMQGHVVDGQDVLAVHEVVSMAAEHARSGGGPVLVEALTYRFGDHSYLMSKLGQYRDESEVEEWRSNRDPIQLFRDVLENDGVLNSEGFNELLESVDQEIDDAVEFSKASPDPVLANLWNDMYVDASGFAKRSHHQKWLASHQ